MYRIWHSKENRNEIIAFRWMQLFTGHNLVNRWITEPSITDAEKEAALEIVQIWRLRLYDLGGFMRCLNESVAVQANKEDNVKERFYSLPSMALTLRPPKGVQNYSL